jgi:hypothetical protein
MVARPSDRASAAGRRSRCYGGPRGGAGRARRRRSPNTRARRSGCSRLLLYWPMLVTIGTGIINCINLVGVEKSGAFVEHADAIRESIPLGHALILNNDYIYKYTTPGAGDAKEAFGRSSYYGSKVIFRATDGNMYVLTLPTPKALLSPTISDFSNFNLVVHHRKFDDFSSHWYTTEKRGGSHDQEISRDVDRSGA